MVRITVRMEAHFYAFLVYSFLGASLEHVRYYAGRKLNPQTHRPKALLNPIITGFPLYGVGALGIATLHNRVGLNKVPIPLQFLAYASVLSLFEYAVGKYVGAGPSSYTKQGMIESWDYSRSKFNLGGIVSLNHFIGWGLLGLSVAHVLHPVVMRKARAAAKA